mmetsp:Transcript_43465/g.139535  ORF Transcript_43465/g.139535 Transcript_43465/m.139535 type:complete len:535 (-) Transcript_43465:101-1705(-)
MRGQSKSESTIGARSEDPVSKPLHLPALWYEERTPSNWTLPSPAKRCDYVVTEVRKRNKNYSRALLQAKYQLQSQSLNTFYRGVAYLFWHDFLHGSWGNYDVLSLLPRYRRHTLQTLHISRTSFWTWVSGDQHLSNFGAWRNRHDDIVYGVNDFDEAVVYDFHIDVWRIAVSIIDHAESNGLSSDEGVEAIRAFCHTYVATMRDYVGNERDKQHEVRYGNTDGKLGEFLDNVGGAEKEHQMLKKFTEVVGHKRRFKKTKKTRLLPANDAVWKQFNASFTVDGYGATLLKVGWKVREWDEGTFHILDLAQRTGSGDGSYGLPRFYVLIAGPQGGHGEDCAVILDVKMSVPPAAFESLEPQDRSWYNALYSNEAARAVEAQRRFTSYTDPWLGWVQIGDNFYVVRERSPWKASFPLDSLQSLGDFIAFAQQAAVATATAHSRASYGKTPSQIKEVVSTALGAYVATVAWARRVAEIAISYHGQVQLDFECFRDWVAKEYPPPSETTVECWDDDDGDGPGCDPLDDDARRRAWWNGL